MAHRNAIVPGAPRSPSVASATGFAADLAWERAQEQAAIAYRAGDPITPTRLWATALDIARKHFQRGDPRLASSLTNNALVMRAAGRTARRRGCSRTPSTCGTTAGAGSIS